jgi:drug/metabolite transporter (DMT)-like permease
MSFQTIPVWFLLACLSSVALGFQHIYAKKAIEALGVWVSAWVWIATAAILLFPLIFVLPIPHVPLSFWGLLVVRIAFDMTALILYLWAMKSQDVSLVTPVIAFSPALVYIVSFLVNKESVGPFGVAGIVMTVIGAYWLMMVDVKGKGVFAPFVALVTNSGTRLMLLTTLIWAGTTSIAKITIQQTNVWFYIPVATAVFTGMMLPIVLIADPKGMRQLISRKSLYAVRVGAIDAVGFGTYIVALQFTQNALVTAVRHTSIAIAAVFAWLILKERIRSRVAPILVMVAGAVLIAFA